MVRKPEERWSGSPLPVIMRTFVTVLQVMVAAEVPVVTWLAEVEPDGTVPVPVAVWLVPSQ